MDDPIPYSPTHKALVLSYEARIRELEAILRHLDRHSLDLWLYVQSLPPQPDRYEWSVVVDLIREVRDAYGLRTPNR